MAISFDKLNKPTLYEVNISNKKRKRIKHASKQIDDWITDRQGKARISVRINKTPFSYKLFDVDGNPERDLWSYEVFEKDVVHVLGFDLDPNTIYIRALHEGRYAVFKVNLQDKSLQRE